jgi:hypothetical protein
VAVETGALHFFDLETGLGIYSETGNGRPATEPTEREGED